MTEKDLIKKIQELRQIKPRKDWVLMSKNNILGEPNQILPSAKNVVGWLEVFPRFFFQYKLAFASFVLIMVLFGTFIFAQRALPGEILFSIKRATEKVETAFVSKEEQPKVHLELANKRLEELTRIAEKNQVKKLAPALEEYQASVVQAVKMASKITEPKEAIKIVPEIKKLEGNLQNLKTYGVEISESENTENIYKPIIEVLTKDLENRTLTDEQKEIFEEAKKLCQAGDFSQALEKILILSSPK